LSITRLARAAGSYAAACALAWTACHAIAAPAPAALRVRGDAIPEALAPAGDVARARALLVARENANCVLCHEIPDPALPFFGNVGPSLAHVATRLSPGQIRLRIVDSMRVNRDTIMPSYYRTSGFDRVAPQYRGRTVLSAQDVEDLVTYLGTLK